ncbi:conserved hypothetical protein [Mesorhizobium metallidurans STM 2683]|uniref:ATP-grasp domain-containing protein n=1 Tax=Mesorhizobium metallidurans STM 2683 TaxID=1297569 RepID=M5EWJ9_9HYPH|nr:ATP-grasp domain-containing protein [Mesorhizobium metallidurans]CCV09394.1 conserved hypothetical protein [Mesorhizobium metallidurans STM 2683]
MKTYLVCCPTHRDRREFSRIPLSGVQFLFHDYASIELENYIGSDASTVLSVADPLAEIDLILARFKGEAIHGVVSTDDYPGSTIACAVAQRLNLPAPDPAVNLLCQHKYYSRLAQRSIVPDAVPKVALIDVQGSRDRPWNHDFPAFIKPIKSFFSVGAQKLSSKQEFHRLRLRWQQFELFFLHFERLLERYTGLRVGSEYLIVEEYLQGLQVTIEGYAYGDEVHIMSVVDSVMFPGTMAFQRFEYPSSLPVAVQERMGVLVKLLMRNLGYQNGMFNIELIYNVELDRIFIVEINPRLASQFADLYQKVDGYNSYSVMLDIAVGQRPRTRHRAGPHRMAASCVLRTFEDRLVVALPSDFELEAVVARHADARVEVLATAGRLLSQEMQDEISFRYGIISIGGSNREDIFATLEEISSSLSFHLEPVSLVASREIRSAEI